MESVQFEAETRAVSIGKPCRSLRKRYAAVSGISVPSERNLHCVQIDAERHAVFSEFAKTPEYMPEFLNFHILKIEKSM